MRGSRVLSMERVFICVRSTKGSRPAAAMAGAGATAHLRAHAAVSCHWPIVFRHVEPPAPRATARPNSHRKHRIACLVLTHTLVGFKKLQLYVFYFVLI
ncbi:unnamed protein product [Arctia plantaginis]|uniref:Uncharacterized protein n=1 Tax=Arctia plantaginis TaxID=874455 RepID=A0A8S1A7M9_ARCPL|nr:unnamed protein product [Arctia plantaginis]